MDDSPTHLEPRGHLVALGPDRDEVTLHYEEVGRGEPLVLLHGFGGGTANWRPFVADLAPHYRLLLVDLRGHGRSTNPRGEFTHRQAAGDLAALLDRLEIASCSALGMSTGGMTLLHLALAQPGRLRAQVLVSATTHFPPQARAILARASWETLPEAVRAMYRQCATRGDDQIRQLLGQFNALATNTDDMNFTAADLARITARTLVVHGDRDQFFPPAIPRALAAGIPGAELWLIAGGGHVPIPDPRVPFTARVLEFLGGPGAPGGHRGGGGWGARRAPAAGGEPVAPPETPTGS